MTANHAILRVLFVVYPGVTLLDVTGPMQVFSEVNELDEDGGLRCEILLASEEGGPIQTDTGVRLDTVALSDVSPSPDVLIVSGGLGVLDARSHRSMIEDLRALVDDVQTVASTCIGAFLLASTGALTGHRIATHWRWSERLQAEHPELHVAPDAMVLKDGKYWSAGGVTAGIDLALSLVERAFGEDVQRRVAGRLVVSPRRAGGQTQYAHRGQRARRSMRFQALNEWIGRSVAEDLSVENLAAKAGMSPRHFARVYAEVECVTPAQAVELVRVRHAQRLLEDPHLPMNAIAKESGFRTIDRMRKSFLRALHVTPSDYRARFSAAEDRVTE